MTRSLQAALGVALLCAACSAPRRLGTAQEAWCQGYVVQNVVAQAGSVCFVNPSALAVATEGWGPQLLSLTVDQGFSPQVSYETEPSVSIDQDKVTTSLQKELEFSLTASVNLQAETTVAVPTDAYYRVEAYPEYQVLTFDVMVDPCGPTPGSFLTSGSVDRPIGVYFRVMDYVGGAWNALSPPSPSAILPPPPDGGAGGAGGAGSGTDGGTGGHP